MAGFRTCTQRALWLRALWLAALVPCFATGCAIPTAIPSVCSMEDEIEAEVAYAPIPRELDKVSLPTYRVEPPDILLIDAVNNIRPPSYQLRAGDVLNVRLANPEPLEPVDENANPLEMQFMIQSEALAKIIDGEYRIQPDGNLNLGPLYGEVRIEGLTLNEAHRAIRQHLMAYTQDAMGRPAGIRDPKISVTLPDIAGLQAIAGEHLVRPDGTVSLGIYGGVYVAGLTLQEVKMVVEAHLAQFIHQPEVNVDVLAYNSKVYYVVTDGGGFGEQVVRLPATGNETVLDAVAQIGGLREFSSKRIWVARPAPAGTGCAQVMDVDWHAIVAEGKTATNYQVLPGDRIYIKADPLIAVDTFIARVTAPVERVFGVTLLGNAVVRSLSGQFGGGGGFGGGGFF